jgi:galactokinase
LKVSTPGRICLFGEHQDYLELPVISCAISLRVNLEALPRPDHTILIHAAPVGREWTIQLDAPLEYEEERDYFRSGIKVLRDTGLTFSKGFECTIHGAIPIRAGASSSSAMIVSWINLLARMSDQQKELSPEECAIFAYVTEVLEFDGAGGRMDQYATALGGVLFQSYHPSVRIETLTPALGTFVLGDSGEPKDTQGILSRVKNRVVSLVKRISSRYPDFSLQAATREDLDRYSSDFDVGEKSLLLATICNRDITLNARELLTASSLDERAFGDLLNEHQSILRSDLDISTPKIDRMLDAALAVGAFGGKINGSGGGGSMFVYAPEDPDVVAEAITMVGGKPYIVRVDDGTRVE